MSRFYASIQGARGVATRQGTPRSGITGHVRGWDIGAEVRCIAEGNDDVVAVDITGGSNGYSSKALATVTHTPGGETRVKVYTPQGEVVWTL